MEGKITGKLLRNKVKFTFPLIIYLSFPDISDPPIWFAVSSIAIMILATTSTEKVI